MAIEPRDSHLPPAVGDAVPGAGLDAAAFETFFDNNVERVYAFVARRIQDRSIAEELTTATFERAVEAARSGALDPATLGAFTLRVAASAVVDHARRARRAISPSIRASDSDEGTDRVDAEVLSDEDAVLVFAVAIDGDLLRRAVLGLEEVHQRVLMLAYFDGLAPAEIATTLGCSVADVSLRMHRALRALRGVVGEASTDAA